MARKGNGYDAVMAIAGAVERCGCPAEKWFGCAKKFSGANGFNVSAEARKFADIQAGQSMDASRTTLPAVIAFADWIAVSSARNIANKMACSDGPKH